MKRLPDNRQTLLFSATLPKMIVDFAKAGLTDPVLVRLDVDTKISDKLSMLFFTCRDNDKLSALLYLARMAIQNNEQTIVFCATMKHVEYVVAILNEAGLDCCFLYSQLDPMARKMNIQRCENCLLVKYVTCLILCPSCLMKKFLVLVSFRGGGNLRFFWSRKIY